MQSCEEDLKENNAFKVKSNYEEIFLPSFFFWPRGMWDLSSNPCPLQRKPRVLTARPPGKSHYHFIHSFIYVFILWLCWVFVSVRGLSLVAASGGHSSSRCAGLSRSWPLLLRSTGSRRAGSVIVAHGPSCSAACGIFPDQGSNPCPLHWQADSQPLRHQGSPLPFHFEL